jgi:hypothetical protein
VDPGPGSYVPGLVHYGSYGTSPNREFWAVFRQQRLLVVDIEAWRYARLVLAVRSPDMIAADIQGALEKGRS